MTRERHRRGFALWIEPAEHRDLREQCKTATAPMQERSVSCGSPVSRLTNNTSRKGDQSFPRLRTYPLWIRARPAASPIDEWCRENRDEISYEPHSLSSQSQRGKDGGRLAAEQSRKPDAFTQLLDAGVTAASSSGLMRGSHARNEDSTPGRLGMRGRWRV